MKVAILTFTYGDNYGQRLQNLAVQEILHSYFEDVYTIKQTPLEYPIGFNIKKNVKQLLSGNYCCLLMRHQNFLRFDEKYIRYYDIPIAEKTASSFPEKDFDYYIAGSDQIWSPYSEDVNSTLFLQFASPDKRIALSPSIAAEEVPTNKVELYKKYLTGFRYLSSREYTGSQLISMLSGKKVETLIDPTLMFDADFWDKYEKKPDIELQDDYALIYMLGSNQENEKIKSFCSTHKLKMVNLMKEKKYLTLGPDAFIYLIHNAKIVFTDSYHGTIFSILHRKPFVVSNRGGTSLNMNSRFQTLYCKLGIRSRSFSQLDTSAPFEIDFEGIFEKLRDERAIFREYLERCLVEEKGYDN